MRPLTPSPARTALPADHFETQRSPRDFGDGTLGVNSYERFTARILAWPECLISLRTFEKLASLHCSQTVEERTVCFV